MNKYKKLSEQRILKELMEGNFLAIEFHTGFSTVTSLFKIRNYFIHCLDKDSNFKWVKTNYSLGKLVCTGKEVMIIKPEEVKAFIKEMKESA